MGCPSRRALDRARPLLRMSGLDEIEAGAGGLPAFLIFRQSRRGFGAAADAAG